MQHALVSYFYWKNADLAALFGDFATKPCIFADSGAFSVRSQGAEVSLDKYADWLKKWGTVFTYYANLDVIGDVRETDANQKRLEDKGLTPIPVFHWGSPFAELDRLCSEYPYVALGGIARLQKRIALPWVAECFRVNGGRAGFHGFGATGVELMQSFAWRSVDSSAWVMPQKFGIVSLFDGRKMTRAKYGANASRSDADFLRRTSTQSLLARNGITSELVLGRAPKNAGEYQGMIAIRRIEEWMRRARRAKAPRVYLAIALARHVEMMKRYEKEEEKHAHVHP